MGWDVVGGALRSDVSTFHFTVHFPSHPSILPELSGYRHTCSFAILRTFWLELRITVRIRICAIISQCATDARH